MYYYDKVYRPKNQDSSHELHTISLFGAHAKPKTSASLEPEPRQRAAIAGRRLRIAIDR